MYIVFLIKLGAGGFLNMSPNTLIVQMADFSFYCGIFTLWCAPENIPEWLQPGEDHHANHVQGFIRTKDNETSITNRLENRFGPEHHNRFHFSPTHATVRFNVHEWYFVRYFNTYTHDREHTPEQPNFPPKEYLYIVVPGGPVYYGELRRFTPPGWYDPRAQA